MKFNWDYLFENTVSQELKKLDKKNVEKLKQLADLFWNDKWPQGVEQKTKESIIKWTTLTYSKDETKIPEITEKLEQSLDYIFSHFHKLNFNDSKLNIEKIENENNLWHQQMAQQETKLGMRGRIGRKIIVFPDGWSWVNLDRGSCDIEGKAMGHCGNAGAISGDTVLSLRDAKNVPHATFILNNGALGEMKGRSNKKPDQSLHKYIKTLLMSPEVKTLKGGGYMPQNNFDISDLSPSEQIEILKQKPSISFTFMNLNLNDDIYRQNTRTESLQRAYNTEYMYRYMGQKYLYDGLQDFENTPEYKKFYEHIEKNPFLVYNTDIKFGKHIPKNEIQKIKKTMIETYLLSLDGVKILDFDFIRNVFVNDKEFFYDIYKNMKSSQKETCVLNLLGFDNKFKKSPALPNIPESMLKIVEKNPILHDIKVVSSLVNSNDLPEPIQAIVDKTISFQRKDFVQTFEKGFKFTESFLKYVYTIKYADDWTTGSPDEEPIAFYNIQKYPEKWQNFVKMSILSETEMLNFLKWYGNSSFYDDGTLVDYFIPAFIEAAQIRSKFENNLLNRLNLTDILTIIDYFFDHIEGNKDLWTKVYEFLVDVMRSEINKNYDKNANLNFMQDKKSNIYNLIKKATDKLEWKLSPEAIIGQKTNQYDSIMSINSIDDLEDYDMSNSTLLKSLINTLFINYSDVIDYNNYTEKRKRLVQFVKNHLDNDAFMSAFFGSLPPQLFNMFFQEFIKTEDLLARAINWFGDFQNLIALKDTENIAGLLNMMWPKVVKSPVFDLFLNKLFKTHEDMDSDLAFWLLENRMVRSPYVRKKLIDYLQIFDNVKLDTIVKILNGLTDEDEINKFVSKYYNIIKQFFGVDNDRFAIKLKHADFTDEDWPKIVMDAFIRKTDEYEDIINLLRTLQISFPEFSNGLNELWEKLHFNLSHLKPEKKAARLHDLQINHLWIYEKFTAWLEANDLLKRESGMGFKRWLLHEEWNLVYNTKNKF